MARDLSNTPYSQNGQSALPQDQTDSLYPPNSAPGMSRTTGPVPPPRGPASPIINTRMTTFSVVANPTVQILLAANPRRNYIAIQNNGVAPVYVGFGSIPIIGGQSAIVFPPNTGITFESGRVPNNDVYVVAASGVLVSVIEGVQL